MADDLSTEAAPQEIYVSSTWVGNTLGTYSEPFSSFADALAAAQFQYTIIYLFAGIHQITALGDSSPFYPIRAHGTTWPNTQTPVDNLFASLAGRKKLKTIIKTFFCDNDPNATPHMECASTRASLIYVNTGATIPIFSIDSPLEIVNVIFTGKYQVVGSCTINPCHYCLNIVTDAYGDKYDEHENELVAPYPTTECEKFRPMSLITITSTGSLTLTNVDFQDFRQQFNALITTAGGALTLTDVNFSSNYINPKGSASAVIVQAKCNDYSCGSFSYLRGAVTLTNNGYEYSNSIVTKGFVYADGWNTILIQNIAFSYNFLPAPVSDGSTNTNSLFYLMKFKQVKFDSCTFNANFGSQAVLIHVYSIGLSLSLTNFDPVTKTLLDFGIDHIVIKDCTFTYNSSTNDGGLIRIEHGKDLQNVLITGCTFTSNLVAGSGLVYSVYSNTMRDEFTKGKVASLTIEGKRVDGVTFPPRYFKVVATSFTSSYIMNNGVVYLKNLANVVLDTVTITTSGETSSATAVTAQSLTFKLIIDNDDAFPQNAISISQGSCQSVLHIEKCYSLTVTTFKGTSNLCKQGPGVFNLLSITSSVTITGSTFTSNTGATSNGSVISSNSEASLTLTSCTFTSNTNTFAAGGGTVCTRGIAATSTLTVTGSTFDRNTASKGAALYAVSSESVIISSSSFLTNTSTDSNGGGIFFTPRSGAASPALTITTCTFKGNKSNVGSAGGIMITDSESTNVRLALSISGSTFESSSASSDGGALYIDTSVFLSTSSSITSTKFTQNTAGTRGGAIYLAYSKGSLTFTTVTFSSNKSTLGACVYAVHSGGSQLAMNTVTITGNTADSAINLADSSISKVFVSSGLSCTGNSGVCLRVDSGSWTDSNSVYSSNIGTVSGVVYSTGGGTISITNASMTSNTGTLGGAVHLAESTVFTCTKCVISSNTAKTEGGAIYVEQNSQLKLDTCTIASNKAQRGSALYIVSSSDVTSSMKNTQIYSNAATSTGTIMMLSASLSISSSSISSNTASGETAGVSMTMSTLQGDAVTFQDQTGANGCFIQITTNSVLTLTGSTFQRCKASTSGGAIFGITSTISITSSTFDTLTSPLGGAITNIVQCVLTLSKVKFLATNAGVSGGGIYSFQSSLAISSSSFSGFTYGGVVADKMDSVVISEGTFENGSNSAGGAISLTRCLSLTITKSSFVNNRADISGGAMYLDTNPDFPISATYNLKNNTYRSNYAPGAGAVYTNDVKVDMQTSYFFNNSAYGIPAAVASADIMGNAGGMMLDCLDYDDCTFNLTGGVFEDNSAKGNGGAVYWRKIMPDLTNTKFKNNSALYAPNVASYPVSLQGVDENGVLQPYTVSRALDGVTAASLSGLAPGQPTTLSLLVALVDHLGNIVKTDNYSPGELETTSDSSEDVSLAGTTKVTADKGIFNFSDFTLSAVPNSTVKIGVASTAIDLSLKSVSKDTAVYRDSVSVSVSLRSCVIGESEVKTSCIICDEGKYSLDPKGNCNSCPSEAICYGNYTMVPKPGYWRTTYLTDVFWACPYSSACTGSPDGMNLSMTGYCSAGYTGNKCQSCESGYSRSGDNQCGKCPSLAVNTARLFGIFLLVVIVIVIMVKTSLNSVYRPKAVHSIYIKIFMNYLQLVMLTASFNLQWPDLVLEIFSYQQAAGTVTDQVFSIDCYIANNGKADSKVFYTKLVAFVLMPVILFAVALAFWLFFAFYRHNYTFLKNEFVATLVILFFLIHPNLVKALFSAFACSEIDPGEYWLVSNLSIKCFDSSHVFYSTTIALPGIIIWGIGIPALCLGMIWKNRIILNKLHMKLRYGFLYNGYELDTFYWEFIILYRKIAIVCCSVFLSTISIPIQALTVLLVLVLFLYMQSVNIPYSSAELNLMELRSIMVATVTIYCGLFYLTNDLGEGAKLFFFALIVGSNAYFLVLWIRCMADVGLSLLQKSVPWVKKIRMLPELDGLEVDNLVNERYINPFVYKRGRRDMFTFIKPSDPDGAVKRMATLAGSECSQKYQEINHQLQDMKYVYLSHMEEVMKQHIDEPPSDFTITPRTPPMEEEKVEPAKSLEELLQSSFDK